MLLALAGTNRETCCFGTYAHSNVAAPNSLQFALLIETDKTCPSFFRTFDCEFSVPHESVQGLHLQATTASM